MSDRKRFISYARVSKVGDRGDDLISPELQQRTMDDYAGRRDFDVIDQVVDLDESGRSFERRKVNQIIERIERGEADGVLLWKWSRWGRNLHKSLTYLVRVEQAGGVVIAVTEDFDTKTAIGRYNRDNLLRIDELLSDQISEGWRDTQARRRELGLTPGGPPPFGYAKAPRREGQRRNDAPHEPDPVTAPVVAELYDRYLAGRGPQTLVSWLNDQGLRTSRGNPFGISTVARVLDNPFNAGYLPDGRHGAHEPLITEATWRAYRRERERRRVTHPKSRQPRWYLGGGVATCALCGSNLVVNSHREPDPARRWYPRALCARHNNTRECKGVSIARHRLDAPVALWLLGHLRDLADRAQPADLDGERTRLREAIEEVDAEQKRVIEGRALAAELVADGAMPRDDYARARRVADEKLRDVANRQAELRAELDALDPDRDVLDRFERDTADLSTAEWHGLLQRVIRAVEVSPDAITIVPWRGDPAVYPRSPATHARTQPRVNGRFVKGVRPQPPPDWVVRVE